MEGRILLDIAVRECFVVLQLPAKMGRLREDEALPPWRAAFLVVDLVLHFLDGVRRLDVERNGLACQRLHGDLHAAVMANPLLRGDLQPGPVNGVVPPGRHEMVGVVGSPASALCLALDGLALE